MDLYVFSNKVFLVGSMVGSVPRGSRLISVSAIVISSYERCSNC